MPTRHLPDLAALLSMSARRVGDHLFDRVTGMETALDVSHEDLEFGADAGVEYEVSSWFNLLTMRRLLNRMAITRDDVFIDFGSGKGRILFLAAHYPFRTVIGVELSARLNRIAARNIARTRRRFVCQDVRLVTADVAHYVIPHEVSVAYFFRPFTGRTFIDVVDRLCATRDENPRPLQIIALYLDQEMDAYLLRRGFVVVRRTRRLVLYRKEGNTGARGDRCEARRSA